MIFANENGRKSIGVPDKLFGVSQKAKERKAELGKDKVIDSTIGVLLDDEGKIVVLDSVMKAIRMLGPEDYAPYAPITGLPEYLEAVKNIVFIDGVPEGCHIRACYTPGGTGAIRHAVSAYTKPGDKILTSDWHWSPYNIVAQEIGREVATYQLFDEKKHVNYHSFDAELDKILKVQDETVVIINTPAHNPTGYTFTYEDWDNVLSVIKKYKNKKIAVLVDIAYLDFSGDAHEYRGFLNKLVGLPENILPLIAFSASKGYTMYGMRCGAIMCMAPTKEIADEFRDVVSVQSRGSWSNGNRAAMKVIANILENPELYEEVKKEREGWLVKLRRRGTAFVEKAKEVGLDIIPYDSGFFITIPCDNPDEICAKLQEKNLFTVPLSKGIRVSVASNTIDECQRMPEIIKSLFV